MIPKSKDSGKRIAALPQAEISSQCPGRTRVRISEKKRDRAFFEKLQKSLAKAPEVKQVTANPLTGSLLVIHENDFEPISHFAHEHGLFDVVAEIPPQAPLSHRVVHRMVGMNQNVKEATEGSYDLSSIAFLGLAGAAFFQILRGEWFPPASSLISDAVRVLPTNGMIKGHVAKGGAPKAEG